MKPFAKSLLESDRTYAYRIKVVGDIPKDFFKQFEEKLSQFDIAKNLPGGDAHPGRRARTGS